MPQTRAAVAALLVRGTGAKVRGTGGYGCGGARCAGAWGMSAVMRSRSA